MTCETNSPLSRELQRELLFLLRQAFPRPVFGPNVPNFGQEAIIANLRYLEQHGLCSGGLQRSADGSFSFSGGTTITAAGLDFLEDDGGLSAILGVVTVKIHADTLRELLKTEVDRSNVSPEDKSWLKRELDKLPQAALSAATTELVREGILHLSSPIGWIRATLGI
jgi:hypothetical protein